LTAIVALTLRFAGGPQVLKVAVGPADGDNAKLIEAIARHLERDGGRIRFVVLPVDDLAQSAKALEQGRADLAVIRSDIAIPQNGATVTDSQPTSAPPVYPCSFEKPGYFPGPSSRDAHVWRRRRKGVPTIGL
jgi:hypothetical protein